MRHAMIACASLVAIPTSATPLMQKGFPARRISSNRLFEQFAADEPAADFASAGADFVQLGIAQ